jgi:hypothetical protein
VGATDGAFAADDTLMSVLQSFTALLDSDDEASQANSTT